MAGGGEKEVSMGSTLRQICGSFSNRKWISFSTSKVIVSLWFAEELVLAVATDRLAAYEKWSPWLKIRSASHKVVLLCI